MAKRVLLLLGLLTAAVAQAQDEPTNHIHYPQADELSATVRAADRARIAGELETAVRLYRTALESDRAPGAGGGYRILPADRTQGWGREEDGPRRFEGVTQRAIDGLRALPPAGLALFRERFDYQAASARDEALAAAEPWRALARVYERYPVATSAPSVLHAMAELALERGDLERAERALRRLLTHHERELADRGAAARLKLVTCVVGLGRPEGVRPLLEAVYATDPEGASPFGGQGRAVEELTRRARVVAAARARLAGEHQPLPRLDPANRARSEGHLALGRARFAPRSFDQPGLGGGRDEAFGRRLRPALRARAAGPARSLPLVHERAVLVTTADELRAWDRRSGRELPRVPRIGPAYADPNPKVQFGGAVSRGLLIAPFVASVREGQEFQGIPITVRLPIRKLAGFDLEQWRWTWNHARDLQDTPLAGWSFPSPPVAEAGVLYASAYSIEGFVNCYATAFDARSGAPLWQTWIASGQVEQTMFGEQAIEPLCTPVALDPAAGVVYHATSFGCVAALDADTGRPLWVTEYEQLEVRAPEGYYPDRRDLGWENEAPVAAEGVVVVAPLDSDAVYGLDAASGRVLWSQRRRGDAGELDLRHVLGAADGRVLLAGGDEVQARDLRTGALAWRASLRGRPAAGRGVIARDRVAVPVEGGVVLLALDDGAALGHVDVASASGNLTLCGEDIVVAGRDGTLVVHANGGEGRPEREPRGF